ncbi:hypothetical protein RUND412_003733 [Rhizina undulata]
MFGATNRDSTVNSNNNQTNKFQETLEGMEKALRADHPSALETVQIMRKLSKLQEQHDDAQRPRQMDELQLRGGDDYNEAVIVFLDMKSGGG